MRRAPTRAKPRIERERERDAGRGRHEVVAASGPAICVEVGHRALAAVALPVGVGDEADRGVEGEVGRDRRPGRPG